MMQLKSEVPVVIADDGSKGGAAEEKVHGVALILQVDAQIIL